VAEYKKRIAKTSERTGALLHVLSARAGSARWIAISGR
jgi:hypothetical protein